MTGVGDRIQGILLGLCVGDRNGGPIRMALELAGSLCSLHRFDPQDVLRRYLSWFHQRGFDTGPVSARVFALLHGGTQDQEAVEMADREFQHLTAGCNPAHRAAPLAMCRFLMDSELPACALREARLTHQHPLAGDVSAAAVVLCRSLASGTSWASSLELAGADRAPETHSALSAGTGPHLSRGGYAPDVLRAAVHFVGSNRSFESSLSQALEFAGSANYCPVLVGAIAGARWGAMQIPVELSPESEIRRRVFELSHALSTDW